MRLSSTARTCTVTVPLTLPLRFVVGSKTARYLDRTDGATLIVAMWSAPASAVPICFHPFAVCRSKSRTEAAEPPCNVALSVVDDPYFTTSSDTASDRDVG